MERSYQEMCARDTFLSRAQYLLLYGGVGQETFGAERYLNQLFYTSYAWKQSRDHIIIRDNGCDLGVPGYDILDKHFVHHINPITPQQLKDEDPCLYDPNNLVLVSHNTHNAIHYGDIGMLPQPIIERKPGDHLLWERQW